MYAKQFEAAKKNNEGYLKNIKYRTDLRNVMVLNIKKKTLRITNKPT